MTCTLSFVADDCNLNSLVSVQLLFTIFSRRIKTQKTKILHKLTRNKKSWSWKTSWSFDFDMEFLLYDIKFFNETLKVAFSWQYTSNDTTSLQIDKESRKFEFDKERRICTSLQFKSFSSGNFLKFWGGYSSKFQYECVGKIHDQNEQVFSRNSLSKSSYE